MALHMQIFYSMPVLCRDRGGMGVVRGPLRVSSVLVTSPAFP